MELLQQEADKAQHRVLQLDQTQGHRPLDDAEMQERGLAKDKILTLTAVCKIRQRQRSRLTWIHASDANTKLFHLRVNGRRRKNSIPSLRVQDRLHTTQEAKVEALHYFYTG
jgi:hypothetical protein